MYRASQQTANYMLIAEVTSIPEWQRVVKWVRDNTSKENSDARHGS
jgi:predicted AAA+ superfamily ATPase